jgi:polar amino acid transport system permease protein
MNRKIIAYILAILTMAGFFAYVIMSREEPLRIDAYQPYSSLIAEGIVNTIFVSLVSLILSLILGFVLYLFSISKIKYLNALADVFTEIIYGTPLLVLVVVTAFVIGPAFGSFNRNMAGFTALTIYMAPYMKNVYKSAISSISSEQYMAMDLFGFTAFQRFRYIIFPQVIRILMPPMMNNFSMIVKGSALLNVLSYTEIFYAIRIAQSQTYAFVEGYLLMWVLYLVLTIPLSQLTKLIERRWSL